MPVLPSRAPVETAPRPNRPVLRPFPAAPRHLAPPTPQPRRLPWKRAFDVAAALALLILTAPLVLAAALLVRLTSKGPAFYSQTRLGRSGRPFTIWKLRTMVQDCESLTGPRWSVPGDPRVTPVGAFLRKTHLDELPQLLNVLIGDMSLVGPRPERPEFLPELEEAFPRYRERLAVRPGVTGLAQVQLPPDTEVTGVRYKLACDIYYARHVSPWLDLRLLACTALYAVGIPFRHTARLFRLPTAPAAERAVGDVATPPARWRKSA